MTHPFSDLWNDDTELYPQIAELVEGRQTILDAGCGDGSLAYYLAGLGHEVIGVDNYFSGNPEDLPEETDQAHFLLADATNLPFGYDSFDAVVSVSMLHETNGALAIGEMRKVLKPDGLIVIADSVKLNPLGALSTGIRRAWVGRGKTPKPADTIKPDLGWVKSREAVTSGLPGCTWRKVGSGRFIATWQRDNNLG